MVQVTEVPGSTSWVSARMSWNGHIGSITSGKRAFSWRPSKRPVAPTGDGRVVHQTTLLILAGSPVTDGKGIGALVDLQVFDLRREAALVLVADEEGDGADQFD